MTIPISSTPEATLEQRFLHALASVLPATRPIALHEPLFRGNEWSYVKECIDTGWVSSVGKFVDGFERRLEEITGSRFAVATCSGTAALHAALKVSGVEPGDEVLIPALTFVATANAVVHCGGIPHFVDSEESNLGICAASLREYLHFVAERNNGFARNRQTGRRISAMVPMHAFGHPSDLEGLLRISNELSIPLVEDAAESLGSLYTGKHTGTFGKLGALSFNGNKIVTTGGGGAILTQDPLLARHAKHITTTAKIPHCWEFVHDEIAWNYRLPNLNAALGCAQLESLPSIISSKRNLAERYRKAFADDPDLRFVEEPTGSRSNYWLCTTMLRNPDVGLRNRLLAAANDVGFMVRPAWNLLCTLPMFASCPSAPLPVARMLADGIINLPSSPAIAMNAVV